MKINTSRSIAPAATARRMIASTRGDRQDPAQWSRQEFTLGSRKGRVRHKQSERRQLDAISYPVWQVTSRRIAEVLHRAYRVSRYRPFRMGSKGTRRRVEKGDAAARCESASPRKTSRGGSLTLMNSGLGPSRAASYWTIRETKSSKF